MASCPFRRSSSHVLPSNGALKRAFTVRQCSIQISAGEEAEEEDKNTLNLKQLNAAILILTAPSVPGSGYRYHVEYLEIPYYNKDYIENPKFVHFPLNNTTAFNISARLKQDLGLNEYGNITLYKILKNNDQRLIPTRGLHESPCNMLRNNIFGCRDVTQTINITKCPIRSAYYELDNFIPDLSRVPPNLLPFGRYKVCGYLYASGIHIGTACGQGSAKPK